MPHGCSHIGLGTLDLDRRRDFCKRVLGFRAVRCWDPTGIRLECCCGAPVR